MILNKENIKNLTIGDKFWIAYQMKLPEGVIYLGIFDDNYCFGKPYNRNFHCVHINHPEYDGNPSGLDITHMASTYEECCVIQRGLFCDLIDHFNKHQFKENPINYKNSNETT